MNPSLSLPAPLPLTPEIAANLSGMLGKIYQYCRANRAEPTGRPDVTWEMDLRARSFSVCSSPGAAPAELHRLTFTPFHDARGEVVGSHFLFGLAGGVESYFVRERVGFTALQNYLTGREFERTFSPPLPEPIAPEEWDRWGHGLTADIGRHYEAVIYPRVVDTLKTICARQPDRPLDVMDLGGGAGQLSELVCRSVPGVRRVRLLERSAALIEKARPRAARHPGRLVAARADITAGTFSIDEKEAPDVVILCGVVAQQVMAHEEGLVLMQRCHGRLPSGGFALVPSYSPALLSSREYEAMGFDVHNKTLSVIEASSRGRALQTNDFYILEKTP
jgi:trans-aconitate methyltransferase